MSTAASPTTQVGGYEFTPYLPDPSEWTLGTTLDRSADLWGERTWFTYPETGTTWSFDEARHGAHRIADALASLGLDPGDRVGLMCSNRPEFVASWLGISCTRFVLAAFNDSLFGELLRHQIGLTTPRVLIVEDRCIEAVAALAPSGVCADAIVYVVGWDANDPRLAEAATTLGDVRPFTELLAGGGVRAQRPAPHEDATIFFTSGTTGPAKGVTMSHACLSFGAQQLVSLTRLTSDDVYLVCNPLFHGNAQFLAAYPSLMVGAELTLYRRFSASRWLSWVKENHVTVTNLMGVMLDYVWKQPAGPDDDENDLRCVFAVPAPHMMREFADRFGIEHVAQAYGMTEISMPIMKPHGAVPPPGACGKQVDGWFDVDIVDTETDLPAKAGEVGELVVRSRMPWTLTSGYFNMPDKTAKTFRNLWFHTGDAFRRDEDGWYYFVDRMDDSIRRKGENISSYEIEACFLLHDAVAQAAAVAVAAPEGGEDDIAVFVVADRPTTVEALRAWAEQHLPAFCRPTHIRLVDDLPKTASGKVRKADLRRAATASK